jgi:hypothetical protein
MGWRWAIGPGRQPFLSARKEAGVAQSPKTVLESWSALVGLSGSTYLTLLEELSLELAEYAEGLQWPLLIIGAIGTGSVLVSSWKVSRQKQWRQAHGLGVR